MAASMPLEAGSGDMLPVTAKQDKIIQRMQRAQWLRAAILGANDGLLSTASLMLGIGAAKDDQESMIISGIAGALAGAFSMAVGEFVSVSTQRDIEKTMIDKSSSDGKLYDLEVGDDIKLQISTPAHSFTVEPKQTEAHIATSAQSSTPSRPPFVKLTCESEASQGNFSPSIKPVQNVPNILTSSRSPMMKVMVRDARATMAKQDEGKEDTLPNPYKASAASALAFLCGSAVPLVAAMANAQNRFRMVVIMVLTSIALALFGGLGALLGGSPIRKSATRVLLGGWIAMSITYGLIKAFDRDGKTHEPL